MILLQVLREIESAQGPVDFNILSRKLGVKRSALEGMVEFWVRKGRVGKSRALCADDGCSLVCRGARHCPLERVGK